MAGTSVGLVHPGMMGATVGAAARAGGAEVYWASAGRSDATLARAEEAGLTDAATLAELARHSSSILSVCPPHGAVAQAKAVMDLGFRGTYVDANAVAPASARKIANLCSTAGAPFVDGGIIGPPAHAAGTTRLYLSGGEAPRVAALFADTNLEAIPIAGGAGAASALKMAYAAYTKGSAALLMAIRALARAEGVDAALLEEWARSQPNLAGRSEASAQMTAPKAWRFVGEMHQIADTFAAAGLPDGFHRAAAELYERLDAYKDAPDLPAFEDVIRTLCSDARRE